MTNDPIAPGSISRRRFLGTTVAALSVGLASKKGLASGAELGAEPEASRIPTLDELATGWLDCSQLAHMPSLHNFREMAACAPDLVGVNFLPGGQLYEDSGPRWYFYNTLPLCRLLIDGGQYDSSSCRWSAYQAERRAKAGDLEVLSTNRLVMEDTIVLWRLRLINTGSAERSFHIAVAADGELKHTGAGLEIQAVALLDEVVDHFAGGGARFSVVSPNSFSAQDAKSKMTAIYRFLDGAEANPAGPEAQWTMLLEPGESREIRFLMSATDVNGRQSAEAEQTSAAWFEAQWERTKRVWEERWSAAFQPDNRFFSGNAPVLATDDSAIREIYYRSVLTLLVLLRTNLWSNRTFITSGERAKGTVFYWDTSLFSTLFAMLEPKQMKEQLKLFLEQDPHADAVIIFKDQRPPSPEKLVVPAGWDLRGYAANDLSIFRLTWSYLCVTQDMDFLREKIADQTVLERLRVLATNWQKLLRAPGDTLADYGEAENLLECVPTYIHKVPSFNAADVWMMREFADILQAVGKQDEARQMRAEADAMAKAVISLYVPGTGVWASLHRDGSRVEMRHCYDFATVGRFMAGDLSAKVRGEMVGFVKRELLAQSWMRAQSTLDLAAASSDRPDHGSMGAYDAWPAVTVDAMCALGYWDDAIPFLRRTQAAIYEGVYAQAREFYGPTRGQYDAPVRIAQREGCMRECTGGGAFAETIIGTLFGYAAKPGAKLALMDAGARRGFRGELHHVRHGRELVRIRSGETGVDLRKEA
ncbi:hypothetical protein EDE15_4619 [Edaphobacter aggregans]|uniref:Trehalase n=1 Tax=Edaphobacter aggregans TaxID=570835 RepID=A0A428MQ15_9BACT|nr:hypothetical protein EDE15_4619 [Edaphobacter aggregans]